MLLRAGGVSIAFTFLSRSPCAALKVEPHNVTSADGAMPQTFAEFMATFGKSYVPGSEEYKAREALFHKRRAEVEQHNKVPGQLWTMAVNTLADNTPEELKRLRGYKRTHPGDGDGNGKTSLLSSSMETTDVSHLPENFDWRHLHVMSEVPNQGECGSCWAFTASTVLRAHSEIYHTEMSCSVQELVACTANPHHCGGSGGCQGSTAELAMEQVLKSGCRPNGEWRYQAQDQTCAAPALGFAALMPTFMRRSGFKQAADFGFTGYKRLPENKVEPVLLALYEKGPVAVALEASYEWNLYSKGILMACAPDAVIDHAVTLMGYGTENGVNYWKIMNSWGPSWGERGFLRLHRGSNAEEAQNCGWDTKPELGSGCAGGPPKVWVCGQCGILYDVAAPEFVRGGARLAVPHPEDPKLRMKGAR